MEVRVINISALLEAYTDAPSSHLNPEVASVVKAIGEASSGPGFFHVTHHGVSDELIERFQTQARKFFYLPKEVKREVKRTATNSRGYFDDELTKNTPDWKEAFDFGHVPHPSLPYDHPDNTVMDGYNQWHSKHPEFRETCEEYYQAMVDLSRVLLSAFSSYLGFSLSQAFEDHSSYQRINFYPPCPNAADTLSVNRHTDAGGLTILLQDQGITSLQVRQGEEWVSIPPHPTALTINIGDMMQVWSNNVFVAPEHRVLSQRHKERLSAPFFFNPDYQAEVKPIVTGPDGAKALYKPFKWGDFRWRRFKGDYADEGLNFPFLKAHLSAYFLLI